MGKIKEVVLEAIKLGISGNWEAANRLLEYETKKIDENLGNVTSYSDLLSELIEEDIENDS